ncbi:hypothetical protein ZIOFF_019616 [Zingiber officinale]|uniref:Uncharacterized protein n=1 Tax=Zingiber officinale TaxID=94328 RepID=A0A8J5HEH5_ZINOF|nr:hypothetical protein ZIOFF_019616 [Zingiber officinale]
MATASADLFVGLGEGEGEGAGLVMLTGENTGAVTKADSRLLQQLAVDTQGEMRADEASLSAFANSNYQAVNNSVVVGGHCAVEDPGVHIEILENDDEEDGGGSDVDEETASKEDESSN